MGLKEGQSAPEFELLDQNGRHHKLSDYLGKWVLLYFYPEDDSSGCTKEACAMRDNFPSFGGINAVVLGVSTDSVESHKEFEEKYQLPFTLLADDNKVVAKEYNVLSMYGRASRTSFLINPKGQIAKIYGNVKPEQHAAEVLADLQSLNTNNA